MTTTQFIIVALVLGAAFIVNNWRWQHPAEFAAKWQALKDRVAALFRRKS